MMVLQRPALITLVEGRKDEDAVERKMEGKARLGTVNLRLQR